MIINIRGTSGSGKSTIVRKLMNKATRRFQIHEVDRRQPIAYMCWLNNTPMYVLGHYETACGGCDTITSLDQVYRLVREGAVQGWNVIFEGIMVSGESRRAIELHKDKLPLHVIALDVPLQQCLEGVKARRAERGDTRELNPDRTIRRLGEVRRMMEHLKVAGVPTEWLDREAAYARSLQLLGVV